MKTLIKNIIENNRNFTRRNALIKNNFTNLQLEAKTKSNNIQEIFYLILNNKIPYKCEKCGKDTKFKGNYETGKYNICCSRGCANKLISKIKKRENTLQIILPNGLTKHEDINKKLLVGLHLKGEDNLSPIEREKIRRENDVDIEGLNYFQRNSKKGNETKYNTIDENGLNIHQLSGIKSSILQNTREYKIRHGITLPEDIPPKKLYYKEVWKYTDKNYKLFLNEINPEGHLRGGYHNSKGTHQLDHKYSISEGFRLGILPHIIGSKNNLQMLKKLDNSIKGEKCSIDIMELYCL